MDTIPLAKKLLSPDFDGFFGYPTHDELVERTWDNGNAEAALLQLIADSTQPTRARLIAAEVMFAKNFIFMNQMKIPALAKLYCDALADDVIGTANPWGLLYDYDDAGEVGIRFQMMGKEAAPALLELLQDARPGPFYEGSKEATTGQMLHYRIKDFAAYYISKIYNYPLTYSAEFKDRDAAIALMRKALGI